MKCPFCGFIDQKVLESRPGRDFEAIRRRRECLGCGRRFTTFEQPERPRLYVIKRSGTREEFEREKCLNSMLLACRKRHVSVELLSKAAERVEKELLGESDEEVSSAKIGELVMSELGLLDTVAYIRFASVYRKFETVADFQEIIRSVEQRDAAPTTRR